MMTTKHSANFPETLDPRTKMTLTAGTAIATVAFSGLLAQTILFAATFLYLASTRRARMIGLLYAGAGAIIAVATGFAGVIEWVNPDLGGLSVRNLGIPLLRGLTMMNVVAALAASTKIQDLVGALQSLRLPFCIYLPAVVMVRFLPTFASDVKQVREVLRIKGRKLGAGFLCRHPILAARLLFTPLLFRALKSSESLGVAAELKGLTGGSSSRMTRLNASRFGTRDVVLLGAALLVAAAALYLQIEWPNFGFDDERAFP